MPNPHLAASAIKGCARKTGSETMATNARWMGWGGGGSKPCQATCVHHLPLPIHLLTRCHLSLSTYGGGKCADLQPWHFVIVGRKGGQQRGEKKLHTVASTTALEGAPSITCACVCVCVFRKWSYIRIITVKYCIHGNICP